MGQGAKPGIGGHLPGTKIVGDVSRTRMIPEALTPSPRALIMISILLKICGAVVFSERGYGIQKTDYRKSGGCP